jgi:hypothetical protein
MNGQDNLSNKQLGFAYWYIKNKFLLRSVLIATLLVSIFLMISYFVYLLIFNFSIFEKDYQEIISMFVRPNSDSQTQRQLGLPQSIQPEQLKSYNNINGFDIVAQITNASKDWWSTFDYQFQIGAELTEKRKGVIFPNERKNLFNFAVPNGDLASQLVFSNIKWYKEINFNEILKDKYNFEFINVNFIHSRELGVEKELPVSRLTFSAINKTAYNYRDVTMYVFLNAGGQIVAVNQIVAAEFLSGETKDLEVTFFQKLPKIDSVEIVADINFLDESVFIKY